VLLNDVGRSPLWAALYWWHPLVLKEAANSAHMEPIVVALVMLTLVLTVRHRLFAAVTTLAMAVGAKLWPVLLLPLVVAPIAGQRGRLVAAVVLCLGLSALLISPMLIAALGSTSGLRAYAETWQTNSALFPVLNGIVARVAALIGIPSSVATVILKGALAATLAALAILLARSVAGSSRDVISRCGLVVAALVYLSPAQYPWYALWVMPFLAFWPSRALLLMTALIPLYYARFHFAARETLDVWGPFIVAAIWIPAGIALVYELRSAAKSRSITPLFANA
jgi:alpha-1,6-mannosyltransferase